MNEQVKRIRINHPLTNNALAVVLDNTVWFDVLDLYLRVTGDTKTTSRYYAQIETYLPDKHKRKVKVYKSQVVPDDAAHGKQTLFITLAGINYLFLNIKATNGRLQAFRKWAYERCIPEHILQMQK